MYVAKVYQHSESHGSIRLKAWRHPRVEMPRFTGDGDALPQTRAQASLCPST
jgi:hypothetical protein